MALELHRLLPACCPPRSGPHCHPAVATMRPSGEGAATAPTRSWCVEHRAFADAEASLHEGCKGFGNHWTVVALITRQPFQRQQDAGRRIARSGLSLRQLCRSRPLRGLGLYPRRCAVSSVRQAA